MKNLVFILVLFFCTTCTTYDSALIYHKNFHSGNNSFLRFGGYYADSLGASGTVKPVFFYSDGSCFSTNNYIDKNKFISDEALGENKTDRLIGSWGNYLINADTIQLEKFQLNENNYERIILKGIISKDRIHWTSRKEHTEPFKPVDYSISFQQYTFKPDSARNFIRTKEKYNQ